MLILAARFRILIRCACVLALLVLQISACDTSSRPALPDVSNLSTPLVLARFEQQLFALDTSNMAPALANLEATQPSFAPVYFTHLLPMRRGDLDSTEQLALLRSFLTYAPSRELYRTVQQAYPALRQEQRALEQALRYFQYHFPDAPRPDTLTTFISGFQYAALVYSDNDLAIGLDMFLGDRYPYDRIDPTNPLFSRYLTRTYNADHLVSKALQPLVDDLIGEPSGQRLLDYMIHNGKRLYLLDQLIPDAPDTVKMEVTPEQYTWLTDNELATWAYLLDQSLLYSTNYQDFRKLVEPSPRALNNMPEEAPGRTGDWLGWQIVKAYMRRYPTTSLPELVALTDSQKIMELSRYKPRR